MTAQQEPLLRDTDLVPLLGDAFHAQINRDVDRAVRDRLDGVEPSALTPELLLERYLAATGRDQAEVPAYLNAARAIFAEDAA